MTEGKEREAELENARAIWRCVLRRASETLKRTKSCRCRAPAHHCQVGPDAGTRRPEIDNRSIFSDVQSQSF